MELHSAGLLDDFDVRVHRAPTTYVAGEETAALDSIEGGPGKPRKKPPYPGEAGLFGAPTTVNNVETLAHVPYIIEHGADAYRSLGTADSPGDDAGDARAAGQAARCLRDRVWPVDPPPGGRRTRRRAGEWGRRTRGATCALVDLGASGVTGCAHDPRGPTGARIRARLWGHLVDRGRG